MRKTLVNFSFLMSLHICRETWPPGLLPTTLSSSYKWGFPEHSNSQVVFSRYIQQVMTYAIESSTYLQASNPLFPPIGALRRILHSGALIPQVRISTISIGRNRHVDVPLTFNWLTVVSTGRSLIWFVGHSIFQPKIVCFVCTAVTLAFSP